MRSFFVRSSAVLLLILSVFAAPPPATADWGSHMLASKYYTLLGMDVAVTTSGYQYNWGCGAKDCDQVSQVYAFVGRTGGEVKGNMARIKVSTKFTGANMSFSVGGSLGGPSGSAGVTPLDNGCGMGDWFESRPDRRSVSVDFGDGVFCKASTYAWICSVKLVATGAIRIGDNWHATTTSDTVDVGC